jgi:hypothetical protein
MSHQNSGQHSNHHLGPEQPSRGPAVPSDDPPHAGPGARIEGRWLRQAGDTATNTARHTIHRVPAFRRLLGPGSSMLQRFISSISREFRYIFIYINYILLLYFILFFCSNVNLCKFEIMNKGTQGEIVWLGYPSGVLSSH